MKTTGLVPGNGGARGAFRSHGRVVIPATVIFALALAFAGCHTKSRFDYDFESSGILDELEWKCRTLYRVSPEHATSGTLSLEMTLHPAPQRDLENYPGVTFSNFDPDWTGYGALVFDVYNPEQSDLRLSARIDDREAPDYADRFNKAIVLSPGDNRVSIPFADLVTSGTKRRLDLREIRKVALFLAKPRDRHTLYLDRVRLE